MSGRGGDRTVANAICTYCGCTCDDIELRVRGGRVAEAVRACPEGEAWFTGLPGDPEPAALVDGEAADPGHALDAAAGLLAAARSPLIYGLREAGCEAQERAVELADRLRATIDIAGSTAGWPWVEALQRGGSASATLGVVKNRADLVVLWYVDPEVSHPRFAERFLEPEGAHVAGDRTVVAVCAPGSAPGLADETLHLPPDRAFEALWALRAGLGDGAAMDAAAAGPLARLKDRLLGCRYGVWLYDPATTPAGPGIPHAIFALVRSLNERVPFANLALGGRGNARGAESVLTAHTGYPFAVSFAAGYPRFGPHELHGAAVLERGAADAVLLVGCDPELDLPAAAREALARLPAVFVDYRATPAMRAARVALRCAPYGVAAPATVHRSDGIALRARPALESPLPSDAELLRALVERVTAASGGAGS